MEIIAWVVFFASGMVAFLTAGPLRSIHPYMPAFVFWLGFVAFVLLLFASGGSVVRWWTVPLLVVASLTFAAEIHHEINRKQ